MVSDYVGPEVRAEFAATCMAFAPFWFGTPFHCHVDPVTANGLFKITGGAITEMNNSAIWLRRDSQS
jgi:hypothetical protein